MADGLKILEGLGEGSGHCLRNVNMEDFFACRQAIYNVPRYRLLMTSFHALRSLSTNYNYLSTDIIELLAINCERRYIGQFYISPTWYTSVLVWKHHCIRMGLGLGDTGLTFL